MTLSGARVNTELQKQKQRLKKPRAAHSRKRCLPASPRSLPCSAPGARASGPAVRLSPSRKRERPPREQGTPGWQTRGRAGATGEQAVRVALQKQPGGRALCRPLPPVLLSQTMSRPSHVPHHLIFLHPLLPPIIVTPAGVMTLRRKSHATCL